jgi:PKHD-type hydroxylase
MTWYLSAQKKYDYAFFEQAFSDEEVKNIKTLAEKFSPTNAEVSKGDFETITDEKVRKTILKWINASDDSEQLYRKITDFILAGNQNWFGYDLTSIESLQYSIYNVGSFYEKHTDSFHETYEKPRKLSFVIQLTDEDEYTGGATLLWTGAKPHQIMKKKGSMTLFPSYTLHEVTPIESGLREALVGWVQGPAFK